MTCVTGVSGSGKSTLINQTLYPIAANVLNRAGNRAYNQDVAHEGLQFLKKLWQLINHRSVGPLDPTQQPIPIFLATSESFSPTLKKPGSEVIKQADLALTCRVGAAKAAKERA